MFKVSTPADRNIIDQQLPRIMTRLEILMPINWNTIVIHIFTYHTLETVLAAGPYKVANILDIERFHTQFKKMARGKKYVMASIKNHYLLLEASLFARMDMDHQWTRAPPKSTYAGHAARQGSEVKSDLQCSPLGKARQHKLTPDEYKQIQTLWADHYPVYNDLHKMFNRWVRIKPSKRRHDDIADWSPGLTQTQAKWQQMKPAIKVGARAHCICLCVFIYAVRIPFQLRTDCDDVQAYNRARYAGEVFRTFASSKKVKRCDAYLRYDYVDAASRMATKGFAKIRRIFEHEAYPGGPTRVVAEGSWLRVMGKCDVAGTTLVKVDRNHPFNHSSRFVFLDECYQRPVALWPFDPFDKLWRGNPRKKWFDVIDRNQTE